MFPQPKILESYIKSIISVKSRPNVNYIKACHKIIELLTPADINDSLLPALAKAMLRSPETIVQAVGEIFWNLHVEKGALTVDIGKSLIGKLNLY